jgi:hypothetical protein
MDATDMIGPWRSLMRRAAKACFEHPKARWRFGGGTLIAAVVNGSRLCDRN